MHFSSSKQIYLSQEVLRICNLLYLDKQVYKHRNAKLEFSCQRQESVQILVIIKQASQVRTSVADHDESF